MRTHDRYREYALLHDAALAPAFIAPERLVAARYEPVMAVLPEATLDLTFERDGRYLTIVGVYALGSMLELRETPPIVWPRGVRSYAAPEVFEEVEAVVEPWLAELMLAAYANDERLRVFTDDAAIRADLARARTEGLYGASPLVDVTRSLGPYVYGYRFALDGDAAVIDANGANGAAMLCGRAKHVAVDLRDEERMSFARRWFGAQTFGTVDTRTYDVAFVGDGASDVPARATIHTAGAQDGEREIVLARPVPAVSMVSLDIEDSVPDTRFGVRTSERATLGRSAVIPPIAGGASAGRVLLLVRDDWSQAGDADSDAARVLRVWLTREGFDVTVAGSATRLDPAAVDVVHVIGHRHLGTALPYLESCAAAGVPIVTAPYADDAHNEAPWGAPIQLFAYRNGQDAEVLDLYTDTIARRRLLADGVNSLPQQARAPKPELARVLALSGAAIASGAQEEQLLRELYGYAGPVLQAPAYLEPIAPSGVETLAGLGEFALFHGPLDPATSILFTLAAAAREGLPLVWTGPVANHELLHYVRCYASDRCFYIPPALLDDAELEGLYARARVFIDVSWTGNGLGRVARAASYGASVVASTHGFALDLLGESAFGADPASIPSIAAALRQAWNAAPHRRHATAARIAERCDGVSALVSTVTAYAQAAARLSTAP